MTVLPETGSITRKAARNSRSPGEDGNLPGEAEGLTNRCHRRQRQGRTPALAILGIGIAGVLAIISAGVFAGLRVNLTPSEPLGLWRIGSLDRPVAVGDLVFVCPPPGAVTAFGLARGYFRSGTCPGGVAPLIKTVAAIAGASITVGAAVTIDGTPLPNSQLSPKDGQDRVLTPWVGGIVPLGQLFIHSSFRASYDSRYFGPVAEVGLLGLAQPVFTLSSIGITFP